MLTISRMLLPVDFTELADHAAAYAASLAEAYRAELHVVHVAEPVPVPSPTPEIGASIMTVPPNEVALRQSLEGFVRTRLAALTTPVVTAVLTGSRVSRITQYAQEAAVDLIIIGTHARGVMNRIIFGSVSKSVVESAHCAVLMVPLAAAPHGGGASHGTGG